MPSAWQNGATNIQLGHYLIGKYFRQALLGLQKYTNKQNSASDNYKPEIKQKWAICR
jgi:hypothetical protein